MPDSESELCIRCGHEGHPDDGQYDPVDGDWYCEICIDTAPSGETPVRGVDHA